MTVKEYLRQAYSIDQRINAKIEQVTSLRELTTRATATLSDMPSGTRNNHSKENIIAKMIDLEDEINADIDELIGLKQEILSVIKSVENTEYQTLLELRYLCFKSWEQIAVELGYSLHHLYKIHNAALSACAKTLKMIPKYIE